MRGAHSPRLQLELICARVLLPAAYGDEPVGAGPAGPDRARGAVLGRCGGSRHGVRARARGARRCGEHGARRGSGSAGAAGLPRPVRRCGGRAPVLRRARRAVARPPTRLRLPPPVPLLMPVPVLPPTRVVLPPVADVPRPRLLPSTPLPRPPRPHPRHPRPPPLPPRRPHPVPGRPRLRRVADAAPAGGPRPPRRAADSPGHRPPPMPPPASVSARLRLLPRPRLPRRPHPRPARRRPARRGSTPARSGPTSWKRSRTAAGSPGSCSARTPR
ncbi:hypothetical protein STENM327S_00642 [Streptomyces tendae]